MIRRSTLVLMRVGFALAVLLATGVALALDRSFPPPEPVPPGHATAVFAGGCFWCLEKDMEAVPGVVSAQSGYLGGTVPRPDYDRLSGGGTGHFEAVRVVYDPAIISHRALVDRFFRLVDPTDPGGQFCDRGESYRTAVWATDAAEARTIDAARAAAQAVLGASRPIVTPTLPPATFWPAETFHQDYARKNPVRYRFYRTTCGRDARLRELWGAAPH